MIADANKIINNATITFFEIFLLNQKISIKIVNSGAIVPKNVAFAIVVILTALKKK